MEDKRKVILLAVAGICIVGAGVLLYMQLKGDSGPKPVPPPSIEEIMKDPVQKKSYEQQLDIQKKNAERNIAPAGS